VIFFYRNGSTDRVIFINDVCNFVLVEKQEQIQEVHVFLHLFPKLNCLWFIASFSLMIKSKYVQSEEFKSSLDHVLILVF
jgi:hypothetical protein